MKKIITSIAAVSIAVSGIFMSSCSGRKDATQEMVEQQNTLLSEALDRGDLVEASALADSMSLYVDDLTPQETVSVLMAFLQVVNNSEGRDLETMRKFVDVYDIAFSLNPNDMRSAVDKAKRLNSLADLDQAAGEYRRALAEYDAVRTYGETPQPAANDSTTTSTEAEAAVSETNAEAAAVD